MAMHDYAIFDHDRSSIGRWIGVGSVIISGAIAQIIPWANQMTGWEAFSKATISTSIIYATLHYLFNKHAWKFMKSEIPDISGTWDVTGQTLNDDGSAKYNWKSEIGIEQTWKLISIHQKTAQSQSNSYTATILKKHGPTGGWVLSYSYRNEPEIESSHNLAAHKGFCEIDISQDMKSAKASYFNSGGRKTYGTMILKRTDKESQQ